MDISKSKFHTVLVVGDSPEKKMEKYSNELKVEPYIKYKYLDADKMRKNAIKIYNELIVNADKLMLSQFQTDYFKEKAKAIEAMSSFEYYSTVTNGMFYDDDGNAMSEDNPLGKWSTYALGKNFSYPFTLNDGSESYQARANMINWDKSHYNPDAVRYFETVWALVKDEKEPSNDREAEILKDWKDKKNYMATFKTLDEFIAHNCSYWSYAIITEDGEWHDVDSEKGISYMEWVASFYNNFIDGLSDQLLTLYEYTVKVKEN